MRRLLSYLLISAACLPAADLRLDDALRAVREQPSGGDTRLQIAQTRIAMLEAMSKRRLELRPQLGLFSLANPIGLVASMGLGLLGGRNAVPPAVMADARIDLLAAEAALDRQQFQREVETTQRYYETAERQKTAALSCQAALEASAERAVLERKLAAGQITRLDVLRRQQLLVEREAECRRAERELELAAVHLSRLVRIPAEQLRVMETTLDEQMPRGALRPASFFVTVALRERTEPATLRGRAAGLRTQIEALRPPRGVRFSFFASDSPASQVAGAGALPGIAASLPLGHDNSFAIEKRILEIKLRGVEDDLENLEQDIREQIAEMRIRYESRQGEVDAAAERGALAAEYRKAIEARQNAGLEAPDQLAAAVEVERQAHVELARLRTESRSTLSVLLSVCGLGEEPHRAAEALLIAANGGRP